MPIGQSSAALEMRKEIFCGTPSKSAIIASEEETHRGRRIRERSKTQRMMLGPSLIEWSLLAAIYSDCPRRHQCSDKPECFELVGYAKCNIGRYCCLFNSIVRFYIAVTCRVLLPFWVMVLMLCERAMEPRNRLWGRPAFPSVVLKSSIIFLCAAAAAIIISIR